MKKIIIKFLTVMMVFYSSHAQDFSAREITQNDSGTFHEFNDDTLDKLFDTSIDNKIMVVLCGTQAKNKPIVRNTPQETNHETEGSDIYACFLDCFTFFGFICMKLCMRS